MRVLWIMFFTWMPLCAFAQSPIQDERPNPIDCLFALESLGTSFRTHLNRECFAVPLNLCEKRGVRAACTKDTTQKVCQFIQSTYPALPEQVEATTFVADKYQRNRQAIRDYLATTGNCAQDASDQSYASAREAALVLFHSLRQAEMIETLRDAR